MPSFFFRILVLPSVAWVVIFLRLVHTTPVPSQCQNMKSTPCRCEMVNYTHGELDYHVNCSGEGLTELPATLPRDLAILDFSHNRIKPDMLHTLCKYMKIKNVTLSYNNLNELPAGELRDCHVTSSLDLEGNVLNTISAESLLGLEEVEAISGLEAQSFDEDAFHDLKNLKRLSMKTYQTEIPGTLFAPLKLKSLSLFVSGAFQVPDSLLSFGSTSLTGLHLESASLQRLPNNLLKALLNIETVSLKMKHMPDLPVHLFKSTARSLKNIHISGVHALPRRIFTGLTSLTRLELHDMTSIQLYLLRGRTLEYLDITGSNIERGSKLLLFLYDQFTLKTLKISKCGISSLDANMFQKLQSLENLNVACNEIKFLTNEPFKHIQSTVKEIILKGNGIQVIGSEVFKNLKNLEILDLSENNIHTLNERSFEDLTSLTSLLLQRNKIAFLPSGLFRPFTNLILLNLAYNVFEDDLGSALANAKHLEILDLSNNYIRTLSKALVDHLTGLIMLNLKDNPLHCDCQFLRLRDRLLGRRVRVVAWCFTPVHQRLDDAETDSCTDDGIRSISTMVTYSQSLIIEDNAETSSSVRRTTVDATSASLVTYGILNDSSLNLTHLGIKPSQETYVIKNTHFTIQEKYYMAVAFICSVSLFCVVVLVCLACRNRKSRLYEISQMFPSRNIDIDRLGDPQSAVRMDVSVSSSVSPRTVKDAPSVQIDVVDDHGNVSSTTYAASEVPIMDN